MVGGIIAKKEVYLTMLARLKNVTKVGGRMNEELEPCPFCGGKAKKQAVETTILGDTYWGVKCTECNCGTAGYLNYNDAIKAWNRRTNNGKID